MPTPLHFYVYELVDPRDDRVFYVGKGCGKRDQASKSSGNLRKRTIIASIKNAGLKVISRRIADGLSEREALKLERERIYHHRVANLTNFLPGSRTHWDKLHDVAADALDRLRKPADDAPFFVRQLYVIVKIQFFWSLLRARRGDASPA